VNKENQKLTMDELKSSGVNRSFVFYGLNLFNVGPIRYVSLLLLA